MKLARRYPFPTWILAVLCGLTAPAGCDRRPAARPAATTAPVTASVAPNSDTFEVKLAVLRHLMEDQPLAADQNAYAAYLVRDPLESAAPLADALSLALAGRAPPVVASHDGQFYRRRGRTMDQATGRPVKVFQARVIDLKDAPDNSNAGATAEVRASWQAGRLAGATYRYRLRKESGAWRVIDRTSEPP